MGKVTIQGFLCERCKHIWAPRTKTDEDPVICPKCKSPYWNKPRKTLNEQVRQSSIEDKVKEDVVRE